LTNPSRTNPVRGEIWLLRFEPAQQAEIGKTRPAIVMNPCSVGRLPLRIVVPVTDWKVRYATAPWLVFLKPTHGTGLSKTSAADCFQVKSVSVGRFVKKLGVLQADDVEEIGAAVALCVGA
jgi:mRNA interferase MazF